MMHPWRSLKLRVAVITLVIFVLAIWIVTIYAGAALRSDMQRYMGEQQFAAVSVLADDINDNLTKRKQSLETVAKGLGPHMSQGVATVQAELEKHQVIQILFNGGAFVTGMDGTAIADMPVSSGRIGTNYVDREVVSVPLRQDKTVIGKPSMGKKLGAPVFSITAPIHDAQGKVTGALVGVVNLGKPTFVDKITQGHYGRTGSFLLVAPQDKMVVTASDKRLAMQPIQEITVNPMADQFMQGYEGYGIAANARGALELSAAKRIPMTGWYVSATLPASEVFAPLDRMMRGLQAVLDGQLPSFRCDYRCDSPTELRWFSMLVVPLRQDNYRGAVITHTDITSRKQAEDRLQLAANVFTRAREGIAVTDAQGTIIDINDAFTIITGYGRDEALGQNPRILSSGRQDKAFYQRMWQSLTELGYWSGEIWNRRKDGEVMAELLAISAVYDAQGVTQQYVGLFSDITAMKAQQHQLERFAHFDALTQLPNRVLLADRLQQAMSQAVRRSQQLAVIYLDLDGFKAINDHHGHKAGDEVLVTVSQRMKQVLREGDTLARIGGDEFVAVLVDLEDGSASTPVLDRLLMAAALPILLGEVSVQVSASIGVTFYPQAQDIDADQLLRQADQAMYAAKLAGKGRYHLFDADHDTRVRGQLEKLQRIDLALQQNEFVLHYQPKVNLRTGQMTGAEALIRWQHPQLGLLNPAEFLPVIEDHPLALSVGDWVIEQALSQMEAWHLAGLDVPVSVNIGARQLQHPDFVEHLRAILASHPVVPGECIELEVLETRALKDIAQVSRVIAACGDFGVRFALDDFGTGYSSLAYLKSLRVAILKIDQGFVRDMLVDPDDLAILQGVIGLAKAFKLEVIAEGVETVAHGTALLALGCELAQGFGIARPMPAEQLPAWAKSWRPDTAWLNQGASVPA